VVQTAKIQGAVDGHGAAQGQTRTSREGNGTRTDQRRPDVSAEGIVVLKDKIPGRAHRQATGATDTSLDENGAEPACDRQRVPAVVNVAKVQLVAGGSGSGDRSVSSERKIDMKIIFPVRPA